MNLRFVILQDFSEAAPTCPWRLREALGSGEAVAFNELSLLTTGLEGGDGIARVRVDVERVKVGLDGELQLTPRMSSKHTASGVTSNSVEGGGLHSEFSGRIMLFSPDLLGGPMGW
eukprot:CAMPEP_0181377292 /NCGR_PEP_ID=MMETSP1106-20121128/17818_1 /TAXON_ID=81844 /ORGANISM="Mantoniella antarctica, Strain SL-175" /LENGTH=115 /DNA_ID=CAMNT_0023496015 /DNA_START=913 /DNA_END=1261 /DNA_ORIENTATION=-